MSQCQLKHYLEEWFFAVISFGIGIVFLSTNCICTNSPSYRYRAQKYILNVTIDFKYLLTSIYKELQRLT